MSRPNFHEASLCNYFIGVNDEHGASERRGNDGRPCVLHDPNGSALAILVSGNGTAFAPAGNCAWSPMPIATFMRMTTWLRDRGRDRCHAGGDARFHP